MLRASVIGGGSNKGMTACASGVGPVNGVGQNEVACWLDRTGDAAGNALGVGPFAEDCLWFKTCSVLEVNVEACTCIDTTCVQS